MVFHGQAFCIQGQILTVNGKNGIIKRHDRDRREAV